MARDHLVCEADFPDDCLESKDGLVSPTPPGREFAEFLQSVLRDRTQEMTEIWNEEDYAWAFNCEWARVTVCVQIGRVDGVWLVIFIVVSLVPSFLRGKRYTAALSGICEYVDQALRSDSRIRNLQWLTADEFEESAPRSNT